jgi:hypothetical protein
MKHFNGDALGELKKISAKNDGDLDFDSLPGFVRIACKRPILAEGIHIHTEAIPRPKKNETDPDEYEIGTYVYPKVYQAGEVELPGRDMGATVTMLVVAVQ